jgi:hypothetical protein
MSKIINTTRGLVRPTRDPDNTPETADVPITEAGLAPLQGRLQQRPLGPVGPRRDVQDRYDDSPKQDDGPAPLPGPRGLAADMPVGQIARVTAKSPVSSMAMTQLIGALEQHGRRTNVSHDEALSVLARLKGLLDQVTERRSWPRVPRVRRRVQRKRRDA